MTYESELTRIADETTAKVLAVVGRWETGEITTDELVALVARLVGGGNAGAAVLADLSLSAVLTTQVQEAIAPLGITRPTTEPERLATAAATLSTTSGASLDRWERLARAEVFNAAAESYSEGIHRSRYVEGWVRGLEGDACQLCRWWWREGQVWPADHRMPTHQGCGCVPIPTKKEIPA